MTQPNLQWDLGTAYDFFVSLYVLHAPDKWGLRGAWAAGVRSRLSTDYRDFLRDIQDTITVPLDFIFHLPGAKDAQAALDNIRQIEPSERFDHVNASAAYVRRYPAIGVLLNEAVAAGKFTAADVRNLTALRRNHYWTGGKKEAEQLLYWWTHKQEFGAKILPALENYFDAFFAEEEVRIQAHLAEALDDARQKAQQLPDLAELIEDLSGGVRFEREQLKHHQQVVLAPSFWVSPILIKSDVLAELGVYLFGARSDKASLVPGEVVPDTLYRTLKALADPTRLKIMKYLANEPQTPTELAKKLRLRPPTVIHHLRTLRLAQLVYVTVSAEGKRYAARTEAIESAMAVLGDFLKPDADNGLLDLA